MSVAHLGLHMTCNGAHLARAIISGLWYSTSPSQISCLEANATETDLEQGAGQDHGGDDAQPRLGALPPQQQRAHRLRSLQQGDSAPTGQVLDMDEENWIVFCMLPQTHQI